MSPELFLEIRWEAVDLWQNFTFHGSFLLGTDRSFDGTTCDSNSSPSLSLKLTTENLSSTRARVISLSTLFFLVSDEQVNVRLWLQHHLVADEEAGPLCMLLRPAVLQPHFWAPAAPGYSLPTSAQGNVQLKPKLVGLLKKCLKIAARILSFYILCICRLVAKVMDRVDAIFDENQVEEDTCACLFNGLYCFFYFGVDSWSDEKMEMIHFKNFLVDTKGWKNLRWP